MSPIRLLFIYETSFDWINFQTLFESLTKHPRFDVALWAIPNIDPQTQRPTHPDTSILDQSYISYHVAQPSDQLEGQFDYILYGSPYDVARADNFKTTQTQHHARLLYLPYNSNVLGGEVHDSQKYTSFLEKHAYGIFVRSEHVKEDYRKHCPAGDVHVYSTGMPRLDYKILNNTSHNDTLANQIDGRPCVLWNTRYSIDKNEYATLDNYLEPMLEFACKRPDIAIIWRPHPALFYTLEHNIKLFNRSEIQTLRHEIKELGIILDEDTNYFPAFELSDCLVTDIGSFLIDYLPTLQPVLVTHPETYPPLSDEGKQLLSVYEQTHLCDQLEASIDNMLSNFSHNLEQRRHALRDVLPLQDGQSATRIINKIIQIHEEFSA